MYMVHVARIIITINNQKTISKPANHSCDAICTIYEGTVLLVPC